MKLISSNQVRSLGLRLLVCTVAVAMAIAATAVWLYVTADDSLEFIPSENVVTEVTQLHHIQVARIVAPKSTDEISRVLSGTSGAISIGGARCSMGGQVAEPGSTHLDLRRFNDVLAFSKEERTITVEAGITWRDIQDYIDPHDLSIQIMQTYSNFTVGGSLSVNAHGRYMGRGPIVQSVKEIRLVLADGKVMSASPRDNADLFYAAIGGYGGIGVIAEVTLGLTTNSKVKRGTETMATTEYVAWFDEHVRAHDRVVFHNADLHPPDFTSVRAVSWVETDEELTVQERLIPRGESYFWTSSFINGTASMPFGFALREHVVEPLHYSGDVVTFRNHEASYDIAELEPSERTDETYVLREYFVPRDRFDEFVGRMREIFLRHEVAVINVSVRHASADPGTLLAWARGETFAFVVYYEQGTSAEAIRAVGEWSRELVDAALAVGGTYYLPYQNHATAEQFRRAYPRSSELFELKRQVDPELRFQNSLFYHYGPSPRAERDRKLAALKYEHKPEGQTLLTVPEWYLVWNPVEYVTHLERGRASDDFPFFGSVREYMSLYKKALRASEGTYAANSEYVTMLRVIGASTAVEYIVKGSYEATVGRLFRALGGAGRSREEKLIVEAHRAYSELIFDRPWYDFSFLPWVRRIWSDTKVFGPGFLRRTERKLAFSAEFLVKAAYAELLGWAAQSAYGPAEERVQAVVRTTDTKAALDRPDVRRLGSIDDEQELVSIERWKEFSVVVPQLARAGVEFVEIAGNDDIVVSTIESKAAGALASEFGRRLLVSRVVSDSTARRTVWFVPVPHLRSFLNDVERQGVRLEHIYDY